MSTSIPLDERQQRFGEVVAEYLEAVEAGQAESLTALQQRHPDLAEQIAAFLSHQEDMARLASPLRELATGSGLAQTGDRPRGASPEDVLLSSGLLGDFRILREVGRGGMGVVYEAEQISLGRRVALKVLPFAATMDLRQLQRFHNEARAAACLHHTNIVPVFAVGSERGVHFYAMQFIEGQTLAAVIHDLQQAERKEAPAPAAASTFPQAILSTTKPGGDAAYFRKVAELGAQAGAALDYAHQRGIVHRDIKPANLMVDRDGNLWVTDFGLAQFQMDVKLTMTGDLLGTLRYMSPEQALAKRVVIDHRTDVYSLGATLYELLTLCPAYNGSDRQEILRQIAFEEPRSMRRVNRAVPAELATIVAKAMEKSAAERYGTAQELADDLRRFLEDKPIQAKRPSLRQRAVKWGWRHQPAVWAAAVCLVMAVTAVAGSLGWAARDQAEREAAATREQAAREAAAAQEQAVRQAAIDAEVRRALKEVQRLQDQTRWSQALEVALQIQTLAESSSGNEVLRHQVRERVNDLRMMVRLEDVRVGSQAFITNPDGRLGRSPNSAYGKAFQEYGLDVDTLPPAEAARIIQGKSIRLELALVLDVWTRVRRRLGKINDNGWRRLQTIARAADPDEWRNRFRQAWEEGNEKEVLQSLEKLAASAKVEDLLPESIVLLALDLRDANRTEQAITLLRKARPRHAGNYWVNQELAWMLSRSRPPQLEEGLRYYAASTALQPDNSGLRLDLGNALALNGKLDEAIAAYREAIRLKPDYALAHFYLGNVLSEQKKWDEAIAAYREATRLKPDYANAYAGMGSVLLDQAKFVEAQEPFRKAFELDSENLAIQNNLASAYRGSGKFDLAIPLFEQALEKLKAKVGLEHPDTLAVMGNLGKAYWQTKQLDRSVPLFEEQFKLQKAKLGPDHPDTLHTMANLGVNFRDAGRLAEGVSMLEQALEKVRILPGPAHPKLAWILPEVATAYEKAGAFAKAEPLYRDSLEQANKKFGPNRPETASALAQLGLNLLRQQKFAEAEPVLRDCLKIREQCQPRVWTTFNTKAMVGGSLLGQKKYADAEPLLLQGYEGMKAREKTIPPGGRLRLVEATQHLVQLYDALGKKDQAETWRKRLAELSAGKSVAPQK